MSHIISHKRYRIIIRRKIPTIIYHDDSKYYKNDEVLEIMEETRKKYPLVFYHQVTRQGRYTRYMQHLLNKEADVFCFKDGKKICCVSPFNSEELNKLFQTVYNDYLCNYYNTYINRLFAEKKILSGHIHTLFDISDPTYQILFDGKTYEDIPKIFTCVKYTRNPLKQINEQSSIKTLSEETQNNIIDHIQDFNSSLVPKSSLTNFIYPKYQSVNYFISTPIYILNIPQSSYIVKKQIPRFLSKLLQNRIGNNSRNKKENNRCLGKKSFEKNEKYNSNNRKMNLNYKHKKFNYCEKLDVLSDNNKQ